MVNLNTLINNIVNWMENASWTSIAGGGTTTFQLVETMPIYNHISGSPSVLVYIDNQTTATETSGAGGDIRFINNLNIDVCANYGALAGNDGAQRKEAILRLNEASDYLRSEILKDSVVETWLSSPTNARADVAGVYFRSEDITTSLLVNNDANVIIRRFIYPISDVVSKA